METGVNEAVAAHRGEAEQSDDITVLALEYTGVEHPQLSMSVPAVLEAIPDVQEVYLGFADENRLGSTLVSEPRTADFVSASKCSPMSAEDSIRARIGGIEWSIDGSLIVGDGNLSGDWHSNRAAARPTIGGCAGRSLSSGWITSTRAAIHIDSVNGAYPIATWSSL